MNAAEHLHGPTKKREVAAALNCLCRALRGTAASAPIAEHKPLIERPKDMALLERTKRHGCIVSLSLSLYIYIYIYI